MNATKPTPTKQDWFVALNASTLKSQDRRVMQALIERLILCAGETWLSKPRLAAIAGFNTRTALVKCLSRMKKSGLIITIPKPGRSGGTIFYPNISTLFNLTKNPAS